MNDDAKIEKELVDRAVRGDMQAYEELVRRNQDFIYNSICYMTGDAVQAEDLAQTVFLKALENIESFGKRAKFSTWLYSIMLNTVRNFQRKQGKRRNISLDANSLGKTQPLKATLQAKDAEPWEALVSEENAEIVRMSLASLDDNYREIIVLRDIEGLSYRRLARVLEVSPGTVKSRLSRARGALKQKLEEVMEDM